MFHTQPTKRSRFLFFSSQEEEAAARFRRETDFVTKSNKEVKTDPTKNRSSPLTRVKKCAHTFNCFVKKSISSLSISELCQKKKRKSHRANEHRFRCSSSGSSRSSCGLLPPRVVAPAEKNTFFLVPALKLSSTRPCVWLERAPAQHLGCQVVVVVGVAAAAAGFSSASVQRQPSKFLARK